MIFTGNSADFQRGAGVRPGMEADRSRAGIIGGRSRWNAPADDGADFFSHMSRAAGKAAEEMEQEAEKSRRAGRTEQEAEKSSRAGRTEQEAEKSSRAGKAEQETAGGRSAGDVIEDSAEKEDMTSREALLRVISEQKEEILRKLKNGDTQQKIPIGSMYLTQEEWDRLMESFDKVQEKIQESIRKENGEDLPEKRPDTTINGNKVLAPEDTGHEAKSLEDLICEIGIEGSVEEEEEIDQISQKQTP